MQLIRRILFLIITVICVISNAMADCASGKITLKDGRQFVETVNLKKCENVGALISDKKASTFKLSCNKTKFKCVAHTCPNNLAPDKNGICSKSNNSEQQRFHKNLITHTYQKRNFFDACIDFKAENKTVLETQSEIKELGRKIKYACITDFSGYELSTSLAIGLIERYNWSNGIGQILASNCTTQQNNRFKSGGGHSIRCMSENGVFVEFLFGKMDSLITSREAVAGAVCPVFGFQHLDSNGNQHRCHSKKSFKDMAAFIRQHELMDIKNVNNGYFEVIPLRKDLTKTDELSKILDTDIFKNIVTHATAHIKILLKKYITDRLKSNGYEIESIKFYSARSDAFYTSDNTVWPVEIFACKKNNCKTYIKLFKFRSLKGSPGADLHVASWTALGVEHMSCIMKDGLFDSKHCFFLEEDLNNEKKQCSSTNDLIQSTFAKPNSDVKAEFDPEDNMCVLKTSEKNAKTVKRLEIAAQVGMLVITTIATAGAGSAVAIGLAAGGLLADGVTLWADVQMNKQSVKFLKLSTRCYDATCARKYFEEEFAHMLRLMDRINDDEFRVIDAEMERLVKLLDDKYLNDTYADKFVELKGDTTGFFNNMSTEEAIETVATVVSLALSITNATKGIQALVRKSEKKAPNWMKAFAMRLNPEYAARAKKLAAAEANNVAKSGKTANKIDKVKDAEKTVAKPKITGPNKKVAASASSSGGGNVDEIVQNVGKLPDSKSEVQVGVLDEMFLDHTDSEEFVKQLESEGYRLEYVGERIHPFNKEVKKQYRVFAKSDDATDINTVQQKFLSQASDADRDARFSVLGLGEHSKATQDPNSRYNTYVQTITDKLSVDPDVAKAQANWDKMSESEKFKFMDQTNRKIRRTVNPDALPVSYERPVEGANAHYNLQRTGSKIDASDSNFGTLKNKMGSGFDTDLANVRGKKNPNAVVWDNNKLTDAEWHEMSNYLEQYDIELVDDVTNTGAPGKRMQKTKVGKNAAVSSSTETVNGSVRTYVKSGERTDDFDTYGFYPRKNASFKETLDDLVHENYHYTQDIGMSDLDKDLLNKNMDDYVHSYGKMLEEYKVQPVERPAQLAGHDVAATVTKNIEEWNENKKAFREWTTWFNSSEDSRFKQLGKEMDRFLDTQNAKSLQKSRQILSGIRQDRALYDPGDMEMLDRFDSFFEYLEQFAR